MRKMLIALVALLTALPAVGFAATVEELQQQLNDLQQQIEDMSTRVDAGEKKGATDRISWYGDLRTKADTLHYKDVTLFTPGMMMGGMSPQKYDVDNNILYTTRLRLNAKAKVYDNVDFAGRLSMYKNWGDSTGVKMMDSFGAVTMDGSDGGNTTGDWLRVERAYFDWKDIGGSNFYLSIGRRPSTYGPPSQYRENELRGGTPSGHLVHFNFDGITAGYKLSELTGIEGQTVRFCYGQGYESQIGTGELMGQALGDVEDVHLGGFNIDVLNDGTNFVQLTAFMAKDITDGFKGLAVMPQVDTNGDGIPDANNTNGFISRMQATENLGDLYLSGIGLAREESFGLNYFASFGWDRTDPNGRVSKAGFGGLLTDTPGDTDSKNGYSVYAGVQIPAPMGKLGLEYNWGSKYWFNFTQAQDDMIGSKLAARGQVGEAYYIFDVNPNMFIKIGGLYYDYEYTGSGTPVGEPKKVDDVQAGTTYSFFPVVDKAWDAYASLTVKF